MFQLLKTEKIEINQGDKIKAKIEKKGMFLYHRTKKTVWQPWQFSA